MILAFSEFQKEIVEMKEKGIERARERESERARERESEKNVLLLCSVKK